MALNSGHCNEWPHTSSPCPQVLQCYIVTSHLDNGFPLQLRGNVDCILRAWIETIKPLERKNFVIFSFLLKSCWPCTVFASRTNTCYPGREKWWFNEMEIKRTSEKGALSKLQSTLELSACDQTPEAKETQGSHNIGMIWSEPETF